MSCYCFDFELFRFAEDKAAEHQKTLDIIAEKIKDAVDSEDPEDILNLPRLCREYLAAWEQFSDAAAKATLYKEIKQHG